MVQYKYFHTSRGYVYRLSIGKDSPDYMYLEGLFDKIRSISEGNTFTYATLSSGSSVFMQSTNDGKAVFADGIFCNELSEYPSKYIDQLAKDIDDPESVGDKLPDAVLPSVGRGTPAFPALPAAHKLIPKIVDALVYGDSEKQIFINTKDKDEALAFMNALGAVLPRQYMARVGFSIGVKSMSGSEITVMNQSGESETVSVKIWIPDVSNYNFENYSQVYHVFDAKDGRDSYSASLGAMSKVLSEINLSDPTQIRDFVNYISGAFAADGSVKLDMLNTLSSIYLLGIKKDAETAKMVMKNGSLDTPINEKAMITAIKVLLDPQNSDAIVAEEFSAILRMAKENANVNKAVSAPAVAYVASAREMYEGLSEDDRDICLGLIARDESGNALDRIFNEWWGSCRDESDREVFVKNAFGMACEVMEKRFSENGANVRASKGVIEKIVSFFDLDTERAVSSECIGELFAHAVSYANEDLKNYALSTLMASAYLPGITTEYAESRIKNFRKALDKFHATEKLRIILEVRNKVIEIAAEIPEFKISDRIDFLFSSHVGQSWCHEIVGVDVEQKNSICNSAKDLLMAYKTVVEKGKAYSSYDSMIKIIKQKLLDSNYVMRKVTTTPAAQASYRNFVESLPEREVREDIRNLIETMTKQTGTGDSNKDGRLMNLITQFNLMNEEKQKKILGRTGPITIEDLSDEDKRTLSENVSKFSGGSSKPAVGKQIFLENHYLLVTPIMALIALAIMLIPAAVMVLMDGNPEPLTFIERLSSYMSPILLLAYPIFVFALSILTYTLSKNNRVAAKRSTIVTTIGGLLPIFIYSMARLVFYILSIDI